MVGERREIYGYVSSSTVVQVNFWSCGNSLVLPPAAQANDQRCHSQARRPRLP